MESFIMPMKIGKNNLQKKEQLKKKNKERLTIQALSLIPLIKSIIDSVDLLFSY
jgi:hypothetical protein